jgi:hypothetical protein
VKRSLKLAMKLSRRKCQDWKRSSSRRDDSWLVKFLRQRISYEMSIVRMNDQLHEDKKQKEYEGDKTQKRNK